MPRRKHPEQNATCQRLQSAFGARLQTARRNAAGRRTNQADIAEDLGVTRTTVSNIERGQHRVFLDQAYIAANALGMDVRDLLPAMEEVFPRASVQSAPDVGIGAAAVERLMQIASSLQQGGASEPRPRSDARRKQSRRR